MHAARLHSRGPEFACPFQERAILDRRRGHDRAVHDQRAVFDSCRAGIGVVSIENERTGAGLAHRSVFVAVACVVGNLVVDCLRIVNRLWIELNGSILEKDTGAARHAVATSPGALPGGDGTTAHCALAADDQRPAFAHKDCATECCASSTTFEAAIATTEATLAKRFRIVFRCAPASPKTSVSAIADSRSAAAAAEPTVTTPAITPPATTKIATVRAVIEVYSVPPSASAAEIASLTPVLADRVPATAPAAETAVSGIFLKVAATASAEDTSVPTAGEASCASASSALLGRIFTVAANAPIPTLFASSRHAAAAVLVNSARIRLIQDFRITELQRIPGRVACRSPPPCPPIISRPWPCPLISLARLYIAIDNDKAGESAAATLKACAAEAGIEARLLIPGTEDWNGDLTDHGAERTCRRLVSQLTPEDANRLSRRGSAAHVEPGARLPMASLSRRGSSARRPFQGDRAGGSPQQTYPRVGDL